jgi:hypothetical protein
MRQVIRKRPFRQVAEKSPFLNAPRSRLRDLLVFATETRVGAGISTGPPDCPASQSMERPRPATEIDRSEPLREVSLDSRQRL